MKNEKATRRLRILTACMGQDVHVAGVVRFVQLAERLGHECRFTGPATPVEKVVQELENWKPDVLGLSYRLTPSTVAPLLEKLFSRSSPLLSELGTRVLFAGTPEVVEVARLFRPQIHHFFVGGESAREVAAALERGPAGSGSAVGPPGGALELIPRLEAKRPFPLLRAHLGLPSVEETVNAVKELAEVGALDVISVAPDQDAQANWFHPEDQDSDAAGAGGVPIRTKEDLLALHEARLRGNHPLLRIYAGTRDLVPLAGLFRETLRNAWPAVPLFWFNQMDGRGPMPIEESIAEHLSAIKWHAERDVPVEVNDPHHWGLRDAHDVVVVADAYLCGLVAKKLGVKYHVTQYMFNTPPACSWDMDLARVLAMDRLLNRLEGEDFRLIRQTRAGLASFPLDPDRAKAHLAATTAVQLAVDPDVVHVVTHCEADHAARPADIVESVKVVEHVLERHSGRRSSLAELPAVKKRVDELVEQAAWVVEQVPRLVLPGEEAGDPYLNPKVLARLVYSGVFDAPHLVGNRFALGALQTRVVDGACVAWDPEREAPLDERERVNSAIEGYLRRVETRGEPKFESAQRPPHVSAKPGSAKAGGESGT
ncbi:MAG: hypothetical protein Kow0069_11900 [Promethearchaeota archaeon]